MKPHRVIFALLVGAFAFGDLASLGYIRATMQNWPDLPGVILLGLVFSQQTLVAAWFTFSRWNIVIRLLLAVAAVFALALVAAGATDGFNPHVGPWFAIQLVMFCSLVVPLWTAKLLRWRVGLEGELAPPPARLPSRQFSIWGLLSATTAVAIALGTARQVEMPLLVLGEAVAFFFCLAVTGLFVLCVSATIRHPLVAALVTLPVVVLLCPFAGMLVGRTGLPPEEHPVQWALFGFCLGATIAIAVLALRVAGFRLTRDPPATADPVASKE